MDKASIRAQAKRVAEARTAVTVEERRLGQAVWGFMGSRGSMRDLARRLNVSVGYVCDIAHGRRKVSEAIVQKVLGL